MICAPKHQIMAFPGNFFAFNFHISFRCLQSCDASNLWCAKAKLTQKAVHTPTCSAHGIGTTTPQRSVFFRANIFESRLTTHVAQTEWQEPLQKILKKSGVTGEYT